MGIKRSQESVKSIHFPHLYTYTKFQASRLTFENHLPLYRGWRELRPLSGVIQCTQIRNFQLRLCDIQWTGFFVISKITGLFFYFQ